MTNQYPIFIICRDLLTPLSDLVKWLERVGQEEIHIIDNKSTYSPMVEYLDASPHYVHRLDVNKGHLSPWKSNIVKKVCGNTKRYVVTDADIVPDDTCPDDAMQVLDSLLDKYYEEDIIKVGFGLNILNLPDHNSLKSEVIKWERQFWVHQIEPFVYKAAIDTTFALYKPLTGKVISSDGHHVIKNALRTGLPYVARHTPWYWNTKKLTSEQRYYIKNISGFTHWTKKMKKDKR